MFFYAKKIWCFSPRDAWLIEGKKKEINQPCDLEARRTQIQFPTIPTYC